MITTGSATIAAPLKMRYFHNSGKVLMTMISEVITLHDDHQVTEVDVSKIRTRFRLRTPKEEKISELALSIKLCGLINPITIDSEYFLLAGFHRWSAYKMLGYKTIPCIIQDTSKLKGELIEIEENISRTELDAIETAEHIERREEILNDLGVRMKNGGNQYSEGMITTPQLAKQLGMSDRTYRMKREVINLSPEVRDLLKGTEFAKVLTDMHKLSKQSDAIQLKVANLLITGKHRTFKRAFTIASLEDWDRRRGDRGVDFDVKGRWGIPQSIMEFKKSNIHLQKLVELINKSDEVEINKRKLHFGTSEIPNYMMLADHAEFLVQYYTKENDLILENMMGRGTNVLAALYHKRRVVGIDCNPANVNKVREVCDKYFTEQSDDYDLHLADGVALEKWSDQSEVFDACISDTPYVFQAEDYGCSDWDIGKLDNDAFFEKIDTMIGNLSRLIRRSNYDIKSFHPIILKVGSGRRGAGGIVDMDYEFQRIAKQYKLVLWDKMHNRLDNVWGNLNAVRNYKHSYVQKSHETNLVWVRFDEL